MDEYRLLGEITILVKRGRLLRMKKKDTESVELTKGIFIKF